MVGPFSEEGAQEEARVEVHEVIFEYVGLRRP